VEASVSTVKRRGYDASGRAAAATRRRQAVLDACRDLLVHNGYQATTVKAVAERAGVSTETIYKSFGGKKQLVKSLYDVTVAGDDEPVPIGERPDIRHILATSDPHEKLARYGAFVRSYQERTNVLLHVFTAANPDIAEIRATIEGERLSGLRTFVAHLASEGHLRAQLTLRRRSSHNSLRPANGPPTTINAGSPRCYWLRSWIELLPNSAERTPRLHGRSGRYAGELGLAHGVGLIPRGVRRRSCCPSAGRARSSGCSSRGWCRG